MSDLVREWCAGNPVLAGAFVGAGAMALLVAVYVGVRRGGGK